MTAIRKLSHITQSLLFSIFLLSMITPPATGDIKYTITAELDTSARSLTGTGVIELSAADLPSEDVVFVSNFFGDGRRLEIEKVTANGVEAPIFDGPTGAAIELSAKPIGQLTLEITYSLAAVPESEGVFLLDDNRRSGLWASWYPRVTDAKSSTAAYEISFTLRGPALLAHPAEEKSEEDVGAGKLYRLSAARAASMALVASPIFVSQRAEVAECDLGIYMREGSEPWADNFMASAAEIYKYYSANIPGFARARLDVVLAADDYKPGDFQPQLVIIRDELDAMAERLGGVFAANYLRWQVSLEMARTFWAAHVSQPEGDIPWLREGLVLSTAEKYSNYALLGGPAFENIRQFYLNAAASGFNTSLTRSVSEVSADGIDPIEILARSKGLWIAGMLERKLGRNGWTNFIKSLASRDSGHPLTIDEIEALATQSAGTSLKQFFDDWMRGSVRLDYAVDKVREGRDGNRIRLINNGDAHEPVPVRAVYSGGEEKTVTVDVADKETWVELPGSGELRRVEIDPERTLPDYNTSNNFRSFGSAERIETLYAIDNLFDIGELIFSKDISHSENGRQKEFVLTVTNLGDQPRALGLRLSTRFPGARNRTLKWVFIELAVGETKSIRDSVSFTDDASGLAEVTAEYFVVRDREEFEKLDFKSTPALVNYYVVEVPQM
jgi:stalled ribosome alternative rescue factor ArfA